MDQWDEDGQDWTEPQRQAGPPPGTKSARMALVVGLAVALCVAVGLAIWAWAPDHDSSTSSPAPQANANTGTPGSAQTAPGKTDSAASVPSDACAAVSEGLAEQLGLLSHEPVSEKGSCRWRTTKSATGSFRLSYLDEPPAQWEDVSPIKIDGVSSATRYSNAMGCMIMWPTSYGSVNLSYGSSTSRDGDHCEIAASFAEGVAPYVPR